MEHCWSRGSHRFGQPPTAGASQELESITSINSQGTRRSLRRSPRHVKPTSRLVERRRAAATSTQQTKQLVAKPLAGDAVQEDVDGVVDAGQLVRDGSGDVVRGSSLPPLSADRQHDARRHADEEGQRHGQTHQRGLVEHRRLADDFLARRRRRRRRRRRTPAAVLDVAARPFPVLIVAFGSREGEG